MGWEVAAPLVPPVPARHQGGGRRRKVPDRAVLAAIIYLDRTGCAWRDLPSASGVARSAGRDRFATWARAGFRDALLEAIRNRLGHSEAIDWSRAAIDSISVRAESGGDHTGPSPVDRGKPASEIQATVDRSGLPLSVESSAANVHDKRLLERTVEKLRPSGSVGRPRHRPTKLHADKGYDYDDCRAALRTRGVIPGIARKDIESSQRLGRHWWVVERTFSWLTGFRRSSPRYERRGYLNLGMVTLTAALTCFGQLMKQENNPIPDTALMPPTHPARASSSGGDPRRDRASAQVRCTSSL